MGFTDLARRLELVLLYWKQGAFKFAFAAQRRGREFEFNFTKHALRILLGLCVVQAATALHALEVEDHRFYPGNSAQVVRVLSTADLDVFEPFIVQFQAQNPSIGVDYTVASSTEMHKAIRSGAAFDLVLSSAMDLQFQLANDGYAKTYVSDATATLPHWARWRDLVFAFAAEPAVAVISTPRFEGLELPRSRQDLITLLRDHPDRFRRRIGTYDVRQSGLGYLFATQEARISDSYWRLSEVIGRLEPRLYCCSGQMIDEVANGNLAVAYNVLGSYANERLSGSEGDRMAILPLEDFASVILRTALIPATVENVETTGIFLDALLREGVRDDIQDRGLPPLSGASDDGALSFAPIRLGPGLMVYLDPLNRRAFLNSWENAMEQQ